MLPAIKNAAQTTLDALDAHLETLIAARLTLIKTFGLNDPMAEQREAVQAAPVAQESPRTAPEVKAEETVKETPQAAPTPCNGNPKGFNPFPSGPRRPILGVLPPAEEAVVGTRRPLIESRRALVKAIAENGPMNGAKLAALSGVHSTNIYGMLEHEWFEKQSDGYHLSDSGATELQRIKG